jgi:acyl-CoA synthetase (AMP-forming)/AMP-acid ligase II
MAKMAKYYCSHSALFFAIFIVAAVVISVSTKFQEAEGALLAKDGEASELVSRAKRLWKQDTPLVVDEFGVGGSSTKDDGSSNEDDSGKTDDGNNNSESEEEDNKGGKTYI